MLIDRFYFIQFQLPPQRPQPANDIKQEGIILYKQVKQKKAAAVAINITKSQKNAMEIIAANWGVSIATVVRRLIGYYVSGEMSLRELQRKRKLGSAGTESLGGEIDNRRTELRNYHLSIRLSQEERARLTMQAAWEHYLPGEAAGILVALLVDSVIEKSELWE
jgi:hypothetical protein